MDTEIEGFRREAADWRGDQRRGGRGYPEAMRARALRLWQRLRTEGVTGEDAAKLVGISLASLHLWSRGRGTKRLGTGMKRLVRVQLVPEAKAQAAAQPVRLLSPRGYRVEVLDVATAAALLREVG